MQNQEILKIIDNLKGRKNYEEKKASKLGFASLYDYFEDKTSKEKKASENKEQEVEVEIEHHHSEKNKKSCNCC